MKPTFHVLDEHVEHDLLRRVEPLDGAGRDAQNAELLTRIALEGHLGQTEQFAGLLIRRRIAAAGAV